MKQLVICIMALTLFASCEQRSKIDHEVKIDTTSVLDDRVKDTTKILVSQLPIKFDSTDILIYGISLEGRSEYSKKDTYDDFYPSTYGSSDARLSYFNEDQLTGSFINLVFQNKKGNEIKLTDKKITIASMSFLREIFRQTKTAYLLYSIYDRDTNRDKALNYLDLKSLYVSKIDGTDFKKISKELHDFHDSNLIKGENKVYFRTLEYQDENGKLIKQDKVHYYYIDFSADHYVVTEYNPLKIFE